MNTPTMPIDIPVCPGAPRKRSKWSDNYRKTLFTDNFVYPGVRRMLKFGDESVSTTVMLDYTDTHGLVSDLPENLESNIWIYATKHDNCAMYLREYEDIILDILFKEKIDFSFSNRV